MIKIKWYGVILAGLLTGIVFNAHANAAVSQGMLVMLDFDRTHTAVVAACEKRAPVSVAALNEAFTAWKSAHQPAQKELLALAALAAHRPGKPAMSAAEFGVVLEMMRNASLSKLFGQLAAKDAASMTRFCQTEYPQGLAAQEMNFTSRLLALQGRQ
jgi:hypothetical protein